MPSDPVSQKTPKPVFVPKVRCGWTVFRRIPPLPSIGFKGGVGVELVEIAGPPAPSQEDEDAR